LVNFYKFTGYYVLFYIIVVQVVTSFSVLTFYTVLSISEERLPPLKAVSLKLKLIVVLPPLVFATIAIVLACIPSL